MKVRRYFTDVIMRRCALMRFALAVRRCSSEEFTCGDGSCIDARRRCDQHEDCADGSDEANCGQSTNRTLPLLTY